MEDAKAKMLKDLMGTISPAEMQKVNQVFETLGAIMEVLPPIEVKPHYFRTFVDDKKNETRKEFIAIFIERPQKAKEDEVLEKKTK
jgi:hypothetical protein